MNHTPETPLPELAAPGSTEHMLDRVGERLGSFAARSSQRMQQLSTQMRVRGISHTDEEQAQQKRQAQTPSEQSPGTQPQPLEQAEVALDTMQKRFALVATVAELQFRRTAARVREGAEDILAEAQAIRHTR